MNFKEVSKNLIDKGYQVKIFETKEKARNYLNKAIDNDIVGFGGSVTLEEMELYEILNSHNQVYWHHREKDNLSKDEIRKLAASSNIYISSVNALVESGDIINIDNMCNRVASIFYGHKKVILVIGINKLANDYESAIKRARNIAAPKNAQRLGVKTPCAINGDKCYNCKSPDRICRGLSVLWEKPKDSEYEVILINEELGF